MHLNPKYGLTVDEIERDGFEASARVETPDVHDPGDLAAALAQAIEGFSESLGKLQPNLLLVLGDRHEILSAALAATAHGVPVAHVHGGELSEGSIDDMFRHCVTKLAHIHFVATRAYAERVCQLGERPERVHVVGAAAIEAIRTMPLLERDALGEALGLVLESPLVALTLHPASLEPELADRDAMVVTFGLDAAIGETGTVVLTLPNDDPGNVQTRRRLDEYAQQRSNVHVFDALGQLRYLSLLRHADVVVGNSSSGLIEAPSFNVPVVNVGSRQQGRFRAANVIDCEADAGAVELAVKRALDPGFRSSLEAGSSPLGEGNVSSQILEVLAAAVPVDELRRKRFFDLPDAEWRPSLSLGSDRA